MKKRLIALVLVTLMVLPLAACGKKEEVKDVDFYELRTKMLEAGENLPDMQTASSADDNAAELLGYVSDMDYEKVSNFFVSYSSEGLTDEIVVIAVKNEDDAKEAKESLEKHLTHRKNLFANYSPVEGAKLENAILRVVGRYVYLIIADDRNAIEKAFNEMVK
ncbi:MAG: DUF4358 domain-containing protein [Lachnospiraceae bacterium]|nr:DUF4358 domain-containing protein [Lachnospiraceae bacterium]